MHGSFRHHRPSGSIPSMSTAQDVENGLAKPDAKLAGSAWVRPGSARGLRCVTGATFGADSPTARLSWRGAPCTTPCLAVRAPPGNALGRFHRRHVCVLSEAVPRRALAHLLAQRLLGGRHGPFASPPRDPAV